MSVVHKELEAAEKLKDAGSTNLQRLFVKQTYVELYFSLSMDAIFKC